MNDSEHKDIRDPSYCAADFRVQLSGGRLRWLATILAILSVGLFAYLLSEGEQARLDFQALHLRGRAAVCTVAVAFAIWATIALTNWRAWLRKKKGK
jgi:hypothetical protein